MRKDHIDRRTVLAATTALGAAALMPSRALAQGTVPGNTECRADDLAKRVPQLS